MKTSLPKAIFFFFLVILFSSFGTELQAQACRDIGFNTNLNLHSLQICQGDNSVTINGTQDGNNTGFRWEVSTTNATSGFAQVLGTPNNQNYNLAFFYANTPGTYYFRRETLTGSCKGPSEVVTLTVSAPPVPTITVTESAGNTPNDGISCSGSTVTLTAGGGSSYVWQHGSNTAVTEVKPTTTTTFLVTVTNASGCSATKTQQITVNDLPSPTLSVSDNSGSTTDQTICSGGSATLTAGGGTSYTWQPNGQTTNAITVSPTITTVYTATVKNSNGCTAPISRTITVNPLPTITTAGSMAPVCRSTVSQTTTLSYSASANNPISYSINWDAAANGAGLADQGNTVYSFDDAGGAINNIIVPGNTQAGTYIGTLTLTNVNGCSQTQAVSLNISVNAAPTVTGASATTTAICSGESATITLTGLMPNLKQTIYYTIGGTTETQSVSVTSNGSGIVTFPSIPLGQANSGKTLTIVSINRDDVTPSCSYNPSVPNVMATLPTVSGVLTAPGLSYAPGVSRICAGQVITISSTPGSGGGTKAIDEYRYKTPTEDWTAWSTTPPASFTTVAGTYTVEARRSDEESGCKISGSKIISWVITGQPTVSAPSISGQTVCQDGTAEQVSVTASGGVGNFTYEWYVNTVDNNTGGTRVSGPLSGGVTTPNISTFTPPATALGTLYYYAKVYQSGANCGPVTSTTTAVTVIAKPAPGILTKTPALTEVCPGTPVSASLAPGTGGGASATDFAEYSYDATGVWIQYTPGDPIATAGHTRVQIRTARKSTETGCVQSAYSTIDWNITPLPTGGIVVNETSGTANNDGALCVGGSASLSISGGVSYAWSTGETTAAISVDPTAASTTYQVSVTDAKGCTSVFTRVITVSSVPSPKFSSTENSGTANDGVVCIGTAVTLNVTGGTAYYWTTTNQSGSAITVNPTTTTEYSVTVDNAGCSSVDKYTVYVNALPTPAIAVTENSGTANDGTVCAGTNVTLTATGGTNYLWSTSNAVTPAITVAPTTSSTYTVKATDDNGCSASVSKLVSVNPLPTALISGTKAVCKDAAQPVVTFTGSGGTAPYTFTYTVNNGSTTTTATVTTTSGNSATVAQATGTVGTYTYSLVSVNDASSTACSQAQTGTATITVNPLPTATISGDATVCQGSAQPVVTFTGADGTAPYTFTYKINGGANQVVTTTSGNSVTVPQATTAGGIFTYTLVSVKDASSTQCVQNQSGTATITVIGTASVTKPANLAFCHGATASFPAFTGTNASSFTWTNSNTAIGLAAASGTGNLPTFTATNGGTAPITSTITITPVNTINGVSCNGTPQTFTITINPLPTATISGNTTVCRGAAQPLVTFTGAGGTAPYTFTYTVNDGTTTTNKTVTTTTGNSVTVPQATTAAGTFTYTLVSVKDATTTQCAQNQGGTVVITVNPLPTGTISGTTAVCQNSTAPVVTFTGTGGTAPYSFTYKINGGADQVVTTTSGNTVTVAQPTGTAGPFVYTLVSVKDASSTACSQAQTGTATITVNPLPTITIDAKASLACRRYPNYYSTYVTSTLGFSGNTGNQYSITWDAAGKAAGLTDVAYTSLTATSGNITIQTPDIKDGGIFTGTVTVKTAAGCISEPKTFTLEIATHTIAGPGGLTSFCFIDSKTPVQFDMTGSIPGYTYFLWDINVGQNDPQGQHSLKPPDNGGKPWNFTMFGQNKNWCYQVAAVSPDGCITVSNLICPTLPPETTINSGFASCGPNSTATITASITGAKTVEWEYNDGSGWKPLPTGSPYSVSTSPASSTLTISPVTQAMNGWQYRIKSTGNGPCGGDFYSSAATLTYAIPITGITKNTPPTTYCYGTTASPFTVSIATGNGISYQWYSNTTNSTTGGTLLQGETGSSYTPPTTAQSGLYYYVRVTNVCGTQTAIWGPVVINPLTQITTQPVGTGGVNGSGLYCENGTIAPLTVNATGTTPLVYQWYQMAGASPAPATDPKVGTNSNSFVPPATEGTNNYYVVVSGGCDAKQSNVVPVTVVKPFTLSQLAPPTTPCYQSTVTLRITASVPANVQSYQWYKNGQPITTNGNGATYTITSFTPAENGEYYVVVTGKAPCSESLTSNKITLTSYTSDFTTWTSGAGTDEWHEELNWTCGIPNLYRDALIPIVSNNKYPYVDNAPDTGGKVRNMIIEANGPNLRIDGILKIAGNVTNNGKIDAYLNGTASTGTIEFVSNLNYYGTSGGYPDNGNNTTPLTLSGSAGTHDTRTQHLKISNRVNFTIPVDVYGQLSFAGINRNLNTGDALTLKSVSSTISAMVKDRTNESGNELNNIISGQVTVERFIDGAQGRKWRLVTAPVKGININQGWQDGMTMANGVHKTTTTGATTTPTSKYGTLITGGGLAGQTPAFTTAAAANAAGFDFWDAIAYAQSSIRYYAGNADYTAAIWQPVVSTTANNFDANQAYLLFVRGDRSITTTSGGTTLRPKGLLKENLSHSFTVNAVNSHTLVGNPFASPLNFHKIYQANQSAIQPYFWIWQASLTASWGGYALIRPVSAGSTNYEMVPDGSMTGIPASPIISSGQGFFVVPVNKTTNGTVTIHQTHKDANNSTVSVYREADNKPKKLFANVYIPETTGQDVLLDGILAEYESGTKSSNLAKPVQNGENLSIYRNGRDQILVTSDLPKVGDTLHLRLWNTAARSYRLRIRSANFAMPGVTAVLVDNFLAKETPITMGDGITTYDFRVTGDAASKDQRRFIIVFQRAPLPAITLDGAEKRNGIALNWKVPEDMNVARYELERSTDGTTYKELATTAAKRNAAPQQYSHTDIQPAMTNHYRVKMTGITGAVAYSNTVIVELKEASGLTIYPNPVTGTTTSLQFTAKPQGRYNIVVYAPTGQQVASQVVQHNGGTATYGVSVGSLASGSYTLEVWHPDNRKEKIRLIITH